MNGIYLALCGLLFFSECFSQSLFDSSKSIYSNHVQIFDTEKSVVDESLSIYDSDKMVFDTAKSILDKSLTVFGESESEFGVYEVVAEKGSQNIAQSVTESSEYSIVESSVAGIIDKWHTAVLTADPKTKADFVRYLADWQWSQKEDFLAYSSNRAEREKQVERCYKAAVAKFGVGAAIVGTVWVVSWVVPGGQVFSVSLLVIAKATTVATLSGGAVGGLLSAGISYAQGNRGEELLYEAVNGAADGYLIGVVTGPVLGTFSAVKTFSNAIAVDGNIYTKSRFVFSGKGNAFNGKGSLIGRTIRFAGVENSDDVYYIGKNSTSVFDKSGREVAKVAEYKDNFVLYNDKGRVLGFIKDGELQAYCDPYSPALIKGQSRAQPGYYTTEEVKNLAKAKGQYNPRTGNFIDAVDGTEIIGTPEMGHVAGREYTNELQRAFMNGLTESAFREKMRDPSIYQLESMVGNRSHIREGVRLTIDSFRGVNKQVGDELWNALSMQ